jgi:predicted dehydrogenase
MCVKVPAGVDPAQAAFAGIAAVVINAVRVAELELGSVAGLVGLGLLGQLAARVLSAAGVRVFACDPNPACASRLQGLAGVSVHADAAAMARVIGAATGENGADAVLLCAAGERDRSLLLDVACCCRVRGKVVAVGLTPLAVPRKAFYERELSLVVSRSFGPGVYEPEYEGGADYPYAHVRWTAGRNMQCFLDLLAGGRVDLNEFIDVSLPFTGDEGGYADLVEGKRRAFGAVFRYGEPAEPLARPVVAAPRIPMRATRPVGGKLRVALIGGGNFARSTLLPELAAISRVEFQTVCSSSPEQGAALQQQYRFANASCEPGEVLADSSVDAVVISNRHSAHASMTIEALRHGKHVFVEKPLALDREELDAVAAALAVSQGSLMVGFNRRFAPDYVRLRDWFRQRPGPGTILYRINAGWLPANHWVMDVREGGRFLGELCHYVDLAIDLAQAPLKSIYATSVNGASGGDMSVTIQFEGSIQASLVYASSGHRRVDRERLELFRGEGVGIVENYKRAQVLGADTNKTWRHLGAERGHREELNAWVKGLVSEGCPPVPAQSFLASTEANLLALESALTGRPITEFRYTGRQEEERCA